MVLNLSGVEPDISYVLRVSASQSIVSANVAPGIDLCVQFFTPQWYMHMIVRV